MDLFLTRFFEKTRILLFLSRYGRFYRTNPGIVTEVLLVLVTHRCVRIELCTLLSDRTQSCCSSYCVFFQWNWSFWAVCTSFSYKYIFRDIKVWKSQSKYPLWMKPLPFHQYLDMNFLNIVYFGYFYCRLNSFTFINFICEIVLNLSLLDVCDSGF